MYSKKEKTENRKNGEQRRRKKLKKNIPYVTYALMAINVVMFLITAVKSGGTSINSRVLIDWGGALVPYIKSGQYWRLLTATFLHGDIMHILFNMYGIYIFGPQLERIAGPFKFLVIYILSGLGGSLLSYLVNINTRGLSIGASGSLFGLVGAMIVIALKFREQIGRGYLSQLILIVGYNLVYGFMPGSGIDNFGHIGGLITGLVSTAVLVLPLLGRR